ncbi:MAG: phosphoribosyltransferase [Flavobacteriales bacterium]|nr:phosphoribosyltransferase [Flavobacteriales bacterium]
MSENRTLILDAGQIDKKITRIAHHIYENHYKRKELHVVGLADRGIEVASRIAAILEDISEIKILSYTLTLNKKDPLKEPVFSGDLKDLKGKVVILVDDVVNSGRTLIYASRYILDNNPEVLATAALVDRIHRKFPIRTDYVGLSLSTNLKEHVAVELGKKKDAAYLE